MIIINFPVITVYRGFTAVPVPVQVSSTHTHVTAISVSGKVASD